MAKGAKTGGRKKLTPNKKTAEQLDRAEKILKLLDADYIDNDIKRLTPNQRVELYTELLEYRAPKQSRVTVVGDPTSPLRARLEVVVVHSPTPIAESEEEVG